MEKLIDNYNLLLYLYIFQTIGVVFTFCLLYFFAVQLLLKAVACIAVFLDNFSLKSRIKSSLLGSLHIASVVFIFIVEVFLAGFLVKNFEMLWGVFKIQIFN